MATIPGPAAELIAQALVAELTVVDASGRPVTYPLIPLWDGERVYMTSSTLFSRKLEHIAANPRVSVSVTDPVSVGGRADRVTIQGDAGQALQGLRQVGVGEVRDVLGIDGVHHHIGVLLELHRVLQGDAETGYHNLPNFLGRIVRGAGHRRFAAIGIRVLFCC